MSSWRRASGGGGGVFSPEYNKRVRQDFNHFQAPPNHYYAAEEEEESSDDECSRGQFVGQPGCLIYNKRFEYLSDLGKGTFGKVVSCFDRLTRKQVAIKIVRSVKRYLDSSKEEADILFHVNAVQEEEFNNDAHQQQRCVKLLMHFSLATGPHECLVFEQLGCSLLEAQEYAGFRPLYLPAIKHILREVLLALKFLHDRVGLVHTDLKMENVLFVRPEVARMDLSQRESAQFISKWLNVKLIDFGNATYCSQVGTNTINTRQYRAPEVILELEWGCASDVFGCGCIAMELFLGHVLFQSYSIPQHLAMMERVRDNHRFPEWMIRTSPLRDIFDRNQQRVVVDNAHELHQVRQVSSLRDLIFSPTALHMYSNEDLQAFYDLIWDTLCLDPTRRVRADEALQSRWFRSYYYSSSSSARRNHH